MPSSTLELSAVALYGGAFYEGSPTESDFKTTAEEKKSKTSNISVNIYYQTDL